MAYGNYAPFYRGGYFNPIQTPQMPNMAENQNQFAQPYQMPMQTPTMPTPTPNAPQTPTEHTCKCGDKFILKEDFEALQSEFEGITTKISDIEDKIKSLTPKTTPKTTKKTEE